MGKFLEFPDNFFIEPTNDCNLKCIICPRRKSKKQIGYMSFKIFRKVVDQLPTKKISVLSLHQAGEPLLHPRIVDMVRYAKGRGLRKVGFATNGTLLNENLSRDLIDSGLDGLTVSMDKVIAKEYCPTEKRKELLATIDKNVLQLIELRNQRGLKFPSVKMRMVNIKSTQRLIQQFEKKWKGVANSVDVGHLFSWGGLIKVARKKPAHRLICVKYLTQGVVQWDGDATCCCLYVDVRGDSKGIFGNVLHTSLKEIFLGGKRMKIIEAQLRGNYNVVPFCKKCLDWEDRLDQVRHK
ncbi:radical SAM/SPASM domain-containing protein [Candidatus Omnitrophota bacterium]